MSSGNAASGGKPRNVVITGIAGRLGLLLAKQLHRNSNYHVIGIDRRPFLGKPKDIEHHQIDIRSKKARDIFRHGNIDALVHMGLIHAPRASTDEAYSWNIGGTDKLLEYSMAYEIPKVVVLSSANVYGPRPENTQFLTESAPLLAAQAFPEMRDLVEIDHMASSFFWKAREIETHHLLWPLISYTSGGGASGFRFLPFYGHAEKRDDEGNLVGLLSEFD